MLTGRPGRLLLMHMVPVTARQCELFLLKRCCFGAQHEVHVPLPLVR